MAEGMEFNIRDTFNSITNRMNDWAGAFQPKAQELNAYIRENYPGVAEFGDGLAEFGKLQMKSFQSMVRKDYMRGKDATEIDAIRQAAWYQEQGLDVPDDVFAIMAPEGSGGILSEEAKESLRQETMGYRFLGGKGVSAEEALANPVEVPEPVDGFDMSTWLHDAGERAQSIFGATARNFNQAFPDAQERAEAAIGSLRDKFFGQTETVSAPAMGKKDRSALSSGMESLLNEKGGEADGPGFGE